MNVITDEHNINRLLTRGVATVYPTAEKLREQLMSGRRLRIYHGVDPTAPFLHIGHAVQFRKLREFQNLGHEVILLLGSFTAMIGDPTDKLATRKQLTKQEVLDNAATYKKQASKILKFSGDNAVKLMFNDKWLAKMNFSDVVNLASHFTVQQMMERDMFAKREAEQKPIYLHEFFYPLMQGYDSVAMDVDVELGGNDQTFNMLAGRTLMREMKQKEKFVVATSLLTNSEGKKMSKSEGGIIGLTDAPEDMFGKIMAMDDSMIVPYFKLATDLEDEKIAAVESAIAGGMNPRDAKMHLAETVVEMYYNKSKAKAAKKHFLQVFSNKEMPDVIPELSLGGRPLTIVEILVEAGFAPSKGEAKRLIEQGGVKIGSEIVSDPMLQVSPRADSVIVQKGKRFFVKLLP
ncbi:MAG: tyrosine--tRNA ligase [Patescibacteria group bacterium]